MTSQFYSFLFDLTFYSDCTISFRLSQTFFFFFLRKNRRGWSGGAKVLCILHHWGVQLILAYIWARPAILVVGKGRGECF